MKAVFVYDIRDLVALVLLGLCVLLFIGAFIVSWVSLLLCKLRGHRFRSENPEPFAKCLRCGRPVG